VTIVDNLKRLREFLGLSQREIAHLAGVTRHSIESIEQGRLRLSEDLGFRLSRVTGVDFNWLMADDENLPMTTPEGEVYERKHFELAQEAVESIRLSNIKLEMEIDVAADLLHRVYDAAQAKDMLAVSDFRRRLEDFIRREIHRFPKLRDQVYAEIRKWAEENVATGKPYPKSFLFPRSVEPFRRAQKRLLAGVKAIEKSEKRQKAIKK
jgi:transcriptional regulator with XRE-family HTH domain